MKRLPAFTLTDVIVTMLISMLVMGIAFSIFRFSYNQIIAYQKANDDYKELFQLYNAMQEDFQRAGECTYYRNELQMQILGGYKTYRYTLLNNGVIRTTAISSDTFHVNIENIVAKFNNEEQLSGIIDEIDFEVTLNGERLPYKFAKEYAAETQMELTDEN
jgi:type II secretory pathway pseudopilin PulG